ncbi:MAG: MAPEG family protein [Nevskia sp.]|nr:MAPEG family protein [Nevskia sp.]
MQALVGFAAWTLLLVLIVVGWRVAKVLTGVPINSWTRGKEAVKPGLVVRAEHAHLNSLENLPLFAVAVLVAAATGKAALADSVGAYVLYARVAQSVTHLIGTSQPLVMVRATFWTIQVALIAYLFWGLAA